MAETTLYEIGDLRFWRGHPRQLADQFDEIQALRLCHYGRELRAARPPRLPAEIEYYVGRLSVDTFSDPNAAVGGTAKTAQRRSKPMAVAAFREHDNSLVGLVHGARNVSSKLQLGLEESGVPPPVAVSVGTAERAFKRILAPTHQFVWGSEYVHDDTRAGLVPVLGTLFLEAYDSRQPGTWYPWDEETTLKAQLGEWGYAWDKGEPDPQEGAKGFGLGSLPTNQERWVIEHIGNAVTRIYDSQAGSVAMEYAHDSMATQNP